MENHTIKFPNDVEGMKSLAAFLAEIIKQGLTYHISNGTNNTEVTLTGGY
jgi:hypothetical protein